jgi:hypothetical protein
MRTAEEGRFNLLRGEFGDAYGEQKSDGSNNEVQPKMAPNWVCRTKRKMLLARTGDLQ